MQLGATSIGKTIYHAGMDDGVTYTGGTSQTMHV